LQRVFGYASRADWLLNGVGLVCVIASGVVLPLMNLVFGQFVTVFNNFAVGRSTPEDFRASVDSATLNFLYLFVAKFVLGYIWTVLFSANAIKITRALRIDFVRHTLRQEVAFFDAAEAGSVAARISTDANLVNQGISEKLGLTIQATATFFAAFVVAFAVQWKLTLITLAVVPAIVIVTAICMAINTAQVKAITAIDARAAQLAEEVFSTIRTAHAFWAYPKLSAKYEAFLDEAAVIWKRKGPNYVVLFSVEFFCVYSGYALAFWQGIRMYNRGEIDEPGDVVT